MASIKGLKKEVGKAFGGFEMVCTAAVSMGAEVEQVQALYDEVYDAVAELLKQVRVCDDQEKRGSKGKKMEELNAAIYKVLSDGEAKLEAMMPSKVEEAQA